MYLFIIIFVVALLLALVVAINFADSDVPNSVKLIVTSIIMIILGAGVYYLAAPEITATSASVEIKNDLFLNSISVEQMKKPVEKIIGQEDNAMEKNTQPPIIKFDKAANAIDTSVEQTEIIQTHEKSDLMIDTAIDYGKYKVISKAYFHNKPDENTRRNAFIIHWNNAVHTALNDQDGFIYVTFTNHLGQTSKGWLLKSDLKRVEE